MMVNKDGYYSLFRLDDVLNGGLYGGEILEFFGDVGTGKTQMCLAICLAFLKRGQCVAYFDMKGNFSANTILQYYYDEAGVEVSLYYKQEAFN